MRKTKEIMLTHENFGAVKVATGAVLEDLFLKQTICTLCHNLFLRNDILEAHFRAKHNHTPYQCPVCTKEFLCYISVRNHVRTKKGKACGNAIPKLLERKDEFCQRCFASFKNTSKLDDHILKFK